MIRRVEVRGRDSLQLALRELGPLSPHRVRVRIHAAAINPIDTAMLGGYGSSVLSSRSSPLVLGRDAVGLVEDVGSAVWQWSRGDRVVVCSSPADLGVGCHAESVDVLPEHLARSPGRRALKDAEVASLLFPTMTALSAIPREAALKKVLVVGGSGAVGLSAIRMLKRVFAVDTVVATASERNRERCEIAGADAVVEHEFRAEREFDWVLDCSPGIPDPRDFELYRAKWRMVRKGGRFSTLSGHMVWSIDEAGNPILGLPWAFARWASLNAMANFEFGIRFSWAFYQNSSKNLQQISDWIDSGVLDPIPASEMKLADAQEAFQLMRHPGTKIVLCT